MNTKQYKRIQKLQNEGRDLTELLEEYGFSLEDYYEFENSSIDLPELVKDIQEQTKPKEHIPTVEEIASIAEEVAEQVVKKYSKPAEVVKEVVKEIIIEKPQVTKETKEITYRVEYDDSELKKALEKVDNKVSSIVIPEPIDTSIIEKNISSNLSSEFNQRLEENINALGMPDFRKLAMGLQGQINDLSLNGEISTITVAPSGAEYKTLQEAKTAATAGTKIRVLAGTYTLTNESLAKDDVHWHFEPGVIINATYNEASNNRAVFDDNDGGITCTVTGFATVNVTATTGNVTDNDATTFTGGGCVRVFNSASVFHFEAYEVNIQGSSATYIGSSNAKAIHQANGVLTFKIHKGINATACSECFVWQGGVNVNECPSYISERDAINFNRNSNSTYEKIQLITDYVEGGEHTTRFMSHATDYLSTAEVILNTSEGFPLIASHVAGGRFTMIAGRVTDQIHAWGNSNTICNWQIGTHEAKDGHLFALFSSTNYYTAKKLVRTGSSSEGTAYRVHGGTVTIDGVDMTTVVGDQIAVYIPADTHTVNLTLRDCYGVCDDLENTVDVNASVTFTVTDAGADTDTLTLTLDDGTNPTDDFQATQDGTKSTSDIASEIASAVDAAGSYTASAVGATVSITCNVSSSWGGGNAVNATGTIAGALSSQVNFDAAHTVGCVYGGGTNSITLNMRNCDFRATNSASNTVGVRLRDSGDTCTYANCTGNGTNNALSTGGSGTFTNLTPGLTIPLGTTAYTPTNVTTDRSYNANATTTDELADVLGTLIADLQGKGLIS